MELSADPRNAQAVARLQRRGPDQPPWAPEDSVSQPYLRCGCHPDIVARVWDEIGAVAHGTARGLVHGTPALVHAASGVVVACGYGTEYLLRVSDEAVAEALAAGARPQARWSSGEVVEARALFGDAWFFGAWLAGEPEWVARLCRSLGSAGAG